MEVQNSPFNMRQYNLSILKPPISKSTGSSSSKVSMSFTTPAKSLDLLRQNIQRSVNQDIRNVITKYMEMFFKPGIENIRNNSGPDSVTDDHIHMMCRQILEDAKKMYPLHPSTPSPSSMSCSTTGSAIDQESSDYHQSHHNQMSNDQVKLPHASPTFGIKRESDDTDSEASSMSNASKKIKKSGAKVGPSDNSTSNTNNNITNNGSSTKPKKPSGPSRKHVANWDLDKLIPDTLFIMGAKANKALGFAQTRGRLYVKHPGLFKYASDSDDKEWLSKNKLMPATGGRAYIMLLEDIEKLAQDNKLNVTINYEDIKGFRVPDFILEKMKSYISTWKKQYAEEAPRPPPPTGNRNRNHNVLNSNNNNNNMVTSANSHPSTPTGNGPNINNLPSINPPPPPPLPLHSPMQSPQQQQQHPHSNSMSLNSYHMSGNSPANVVYDQSMMPHSGIQQSHDMTGIREFIQIDKPPPMYPGHSTQHAMPPLNPPSSGAYVHSTHLDPIEQAITKGDWSGVSDRSLLHFALQSTRNLGSWDPQDSFDLIDSVTNGGISITGNISPLLQPDTGTLTAPPVSPNCELSAVLDQAFHYPDT